MEGVFVKHSVRVLQELNLQRQKGQFCDATLAVGSLVFKAHWSVLACCSSFFQTLYNGAAGKIILPETFLDVFTLLLDFFYTGHLAVTSDNRDKLLETAKELCVPEVIQLCQEFQSDHSEDSGEQNGEVLIDTDPDATSPGESTCKAVPPGPPASESPRTRGVKGAQGPRDGPALLWGKLKRVPKTNLVSRAGDVKESPECKELKRPLKSEAAEDAGASHEETPEVLGSSDLPSEDHSGGRGKDDTDEDYVPDQKSVRVHTCSVCQEVFKRRVELRLHMVTHTGEMPYKCCSCIQQFMQKKELQSHLIKLHGAPKPHACSSCSKCFLSRTELNLHEAFKHRGEKLFVCEESSLDKHNRTHTGERPFSCEFCAQRFTERGPLLRHVASRHQEGRPHFCQICGKTFKAVEQLRVHVRRHKGMRKFECTECGYKFTRQAHLRRHMEIHDRVKNYNPRQRKLRNLVIEDEKVVVVALQPPNVLEVGSAEVIVEALAQSAPNVDLPTGQRLCSNESLAPAEVTEQAEPPKLCPTPQLILRESACNATPFLGPPQRRPAELLDRTNQLGKANRAPSPPNPKGYHRSTGH
ncbi:hypothetical protein Chor_005553 [Crotalus horridus]